LIGNGGVELSESVKVLVHKHFSKFHFKQSQDLVSSDQSFEKLGWVRNKEQEGTISVFSWVNFLSYSVKCSPALLSIRLRATLRGIPVTLKTWDRYDMI
jgi:hypothetical protein